MNIIAYENPEARRAICSCNDGIRPVIFKLEATDEESEIDYEPVDYGNRED